MTSIYKKIKTLKSLHKVQGEIYDYYITAEKDAESKLFKDLKKLMSVSWDEQRTKVLEKVINYILDLSSPSFTAGDLELINEILSNELGVNLMNMQADSILQINEKILKLGINEAGKSLDLNLSFDISDTKASDILGKQNLFWIENYYSNNIKSDIDDTLRSYFLDGKTIDEVAQDFEAKFTNKTDKGEFYFEGLAQHTTTTVRNLGKINGFEKAGITGYRIIAVVDDRTSDICSEMNGKEFSLQKGIQYRDDILSATDPSQVKQISQWLPFDEIENVPADQLPLSMALPPYHFNCRTTIEAVFD